MRRFLMAFAVIAAGGFFLSAKQAVASDTNPMADYIHSGYEIKASTQLNSSDVLVFLQKGPSAVSCQYYTISNNSVCQAIQ